MSFPRPGYNIADDAATTIGKQACRGVERRVLECIHVNDERTVIAAYAVRSITVSTIATSYLCGGLGSTGECSGDLIIGGGTDDC